MRTDPKTNDRAVDKRLTKVARLYLRLRLPPEKAQHAAKADLRDIARFIAVRGLRNSFTGSLEAYRKG
jgi:hypothetical protein